MNKLWTAVRGITIVQFGITTLNAGQKITIKGSTTVLPIAQKVAEVFIW